MSLLRRAVSDAREGERAPRFLAFAHVGIDPTRMDWSKNCIAEELALVEKIRSLSELLSLDESVLADIETNIDLVHYSHLRDEVFIDRVADWIASHGELSNSIVEGSRSFRAA